MPRTILKARARARAQAQTETGQSRVSRIQGGVDLPFLMLTIVLVAIGLVMLLSASYPSAYYDLRGNTGGDPLYYFKRQGVFALVGFGVMYVVSKLNYRGLKGLAMPILVVACVLMLAVHVPGLGHSSGGATRWLNFPTQWQPSEVGKIALIIFFAARLAKRDQRKPLSFRRNTAAGRFGNLLERIGFFELVPYLIVLILMIGILYLQPHMSAAIQMVVIAAAMLLFGRLVLGLFISGEPAEVEASLDIAYHYLSIMSVCLPILYMLHIYRSALMGLGDTVVPMLSGFAEMVVRIGVALLLPLVMGQEGIYYAEVGAWTAAAILLVAAYYARMRALSRRKGFALDEKN